MAAAQRVVVPSLSAAGVLSVHACCPWNCPPPAPTGKRRYNVKLWKIFTDCFNTLPIAAVIDEKIFCMHGGLSPELGSLDQIKRLPRPTDIPDTGGWPFQLQLIHTPTFPPPSPPHTLPLSLCLSHSPCRGCVPACVVGAGC